MLITLNNKFLCAENIKSIALIVSIIDVFISLIIFILFDFSTNQFQFVQEYYEIGYYNFYLGVSGLSIYFILLTTIIIPISLLSNWVSISDNIKNYVIIILLLETLLLAVFLVLDILFFYIFFESILPPLFILIGIFGSNNRVKASFYLFLYTLLGSLFLLLSILTMSSVISSTDFDTFFKANFSYSTQLFLFYGIFIAFAVKTPTIFLNIWLLRAHVESPLGGSIILAAIVLKLSLYGVLILILPVLPKAYIEYTYIIFLIGIITILYASFSTIRTIDIKELIAYSSVSHAVVYLLGVFSNVIQGIQGGIILGLAHGFVSPGLFICAGGILYDRSSTRLITFYRGVTQIMPLFSILFFILSLGNCGAPLTLNFVGEFMSIYGIFERLPLLGVFASTSVVFSAAFTIYMYNRISFAGGLSKLFAINIPDLNKREFSMLLLLVVFTVVFGIFTAPILDNLNYCTSFLIYAFDFNTISCDAPRVWESYFQDSVSLQIETLTELHNIINFYLVGLLFATLLVGIFSIIIYYNKSSNVINRLITSILYSRYFKFISLTPILLGSIVFLLNLLLPYISTYGLLIFLADYQCLYLPIADSDYSDYDLNSLWGKEDLNLFSSNVTLCQHGNVNGSCEPCREQCEHTWSELDHQGDPRFSEAPCDLKTDPFCYVQVGSGYHCDKCQAIACKGCSVGPHGDSAS
jgi:NADH-ubiquinone oxidoreductase chain 4